MKARPLERCTPSSARIVQVIETVANRGLGIEGNPIRNVTQYWSLDGTLLAESDPIALRDLDANAREAE